MREPETLHPANATVMEVIEFQTQIDGAAIRLPADTQLRDGQPVRVLLLFEQAPQPHSTAAADNSADGRGALLP